MSAPRLLYLSNMVPGFPGGGEVLVYRHLRRLAAEGWNVTVAAPPGSFRPLPPGHGLDLRPLPSRRWWWPSASAGLASQRLRAHLWHRAMRADPRWSDPRPDCVLTVLWGAASLSALWLARRWRVPLAVWVHDRLREMGDPSASEVRQRERLTAEVLREAARVWTVTEEMAGQLAPLCRPGAVSTLRAVPDQGSAPPGGWQPQFRERPVIAYTGAFHSYHVPYLAAVAVAAGRIGGELLVLAAPDNPALAELRAAGAAFRHQAAFGSAAEALRFLEAEASALTVMVPLDPAQYRFPPAGFPSRLIEFSHLGMPILIAAPPGNPAANWARRLGWPLRLERPDWDELGRLIAQLADRAAWEALSARMRALAAEACDPEKIHRQFLAELPRSRPVA